MSTELQAVLALLPELFPGTQKIPLTHIRPNPLCQALFNNGLAHPKLVFRLEASTQGTRRGPDRKRGRGIRGGSKTLYFRIQREEFTLPLDWADF